VAKIKVLCARNMHVAVDRLAAEFSRATGHQIDADYGTVGALQDKIAAGEVADVIMLSAPAVAGLEKSGVALAGSAVDLAAVPISIAVRDGDAVPDITTPEAFVQTLSEARAIAYSDPAVGGSAGIYLAKLFDQLGLAETIREKGMPQRNGAEVARRVAEGTAELGMTLASEIRPIAGATIIGSLPEPIGHVTVYTAAVGKSSAFPDVARAFIAALARPEAWPAWEAAGLDRPADSA
jgi:molybdate transport system substrate-binding protein